MDSVKIRDMSDYEYSTWMDLSIKRQAEDRAYNNNSDVEAERVKLLNIVPVLLPRGFNTEHHYFYSVDFDNLENCGFLWFGKVPGIPEDSLLIMDIFINHLYRKKGIGKKTMEFAHARMKELGYKNSMLNVLINNDAKLLYESLGYEVVQTEEKSVIMNKVL